MILKLYKSNQTPVLFALPLIAILLWLPSMLHPVNVEFQNLSPLFEYIDNSIPLLMGQIISLVIVLISAFVINHIINTNDVFDRNTFLPALLYVIVMSSLKENHVLSPIVISNLFVLLALRRLFSMYRQLPCKQEVFDASVFLLIAALFYFPIIVLFPLVWIALSVLRPFVWREWILPLISLMLVAVYLVVILFWKGQLSDWKLFANITKGQYQSLIFEFNWTFYVAFALLVVVIILSGYYMSKMITASSIRFRKLSTFSMYIVSLFIVQMVIEKLLLKNELYTLLGAIPLSVLLTFYFHNAKKEWLSGFLFYSILVIVIVNIYWI